MPSAAGTDPAPAARALRDKVRAALPCWAPGQSDLWIYRRLWEPRTPDVWNVDPTTGARLCGSAPDYWAGRADIKQVWKLSCCNHFAIRALRRWAGLDAAGSGSAAGDILEWKRATGGDCRDVHYRCAMIVALRLANWMLALALDRAAGVRVDPSSDAEIAALLANQINHVAHNLESDGLRTNHYISNLSALAIAALLHPEWAGMKEMEARSVARLERELSRQVDAEGVDYEFSTHYHRLVTELFAYPMFLAEAQGQTLFSARYRERVGLMFGVLEAAANRAGVLPQIGDNDSETMWCHALDYGPPRNIRPFLFAGRRLLSAPARSPLEALIEMTGWLSAAADSASAPPMAADGWRWYARPGWAFRKVGPFDLAFVCGGIGANGYGVHDHVHPNELLVSAGGLEFIVDAGTGCYTRDPALRNRLREAASHSTADIGFPGAIPDDRLSGLWRLKQSWRAMSDRRGDALIGSCRCGGRRHVREIVADADRVLVRDRIFGAETASVRWLLHPEVRLTGLAGGAWRLERGNLRFRMAISGGQARRADAEYSDYFSDVGRTAGLAVSAAGSLSTEMEIET